MTMSLNDLEQETPPATLLPVRPVNPKYHTSECQETEFHSKLREELLQVRGGFHGIMHTLPLWCSTVVVV